jgi:hypothetical protein
MSSAELSEEFPQRAGKDEHSWIERVAECISKISRSFQAQVMPGPASASVAEMLWTNKNRSRTSFIQAGINLRDIVMSYLALL